MKTSKRFLGVALALIMIFNVFAIGTFAAGTESAVDLYITADKAAYAAGDEIVLTFSAQAIDAVGNLRIGGQYAIAYDSSKIEPYSDAVDSLTAHGFEAIQAGYDASISSLADASMTTVDAANNWDTVIIYNCCDDGATNFDATGKVDLFTLKMKVKADAADGETIIGFNQASYEDYNAYINDSAMGGIYGYADDYGYGTAVNYGFNNATIKVGAEKVYHVQNQYRPNGDAYDLGIKFGFKTSDIGIAFNEKGTATNVSAVGADIYVNGVKVDKEFTSRFVYDVNGDDSEYQYRVIIEGLAKDDTTEYTVKPYVVFDGTPIYGEEVTVSAAAIVPQA